MADAAIWFTSPLPHPFQSASLHSRNEKAKNHISHMPLPLGLSLWPRPRQAPRQDSTGEGEGCGAGSCREISSSWQRYSVPLGKLW